MSNPVSQRPPSVVGNSLPPQKIQFPESLPGKPAVLLVAYRQRTQQDVDRWLGFLKHDLPQVLCYEIPTIAGALRELLAGRIDSVMRGGVPESKWSSVVTPYGEDAGKIQIFLGDYGAYSSHVVVLDTEGVPYGSMQRVIPMRKHASFSKSCKD